MCFLEFSILYGMVVLVHGRKKLTKRFQVMAVKERIGALK